MHVNGPMDATLPIDYEETEKYTLSTSEALEFYNNGYFVSENLCDDYLIDEARKYIDSNFKMFLKMSKRCDDWRLHFQIDLINERVHEHVPILNLLIKSPKILGKLKCLMNTDISGIFYSQIAYRTPVSSSHRSEYYTPGAEYHIDGQANASGDRFPDYWTVQIGIALVDIVTKDMGNFTVFPGTHSLVKWNNYCNQKKTKTLPSLGEPDRVCLKAGDVVFAHVLLPHRGGKNVSEVESLEKIDNMCPLNIKNIPPMTREMIFMRIQGKGIDYSSESRAIALLENPWLEFTEFLREYRLIR